MVDFLTEFTRHLFGDGHDTYLETDGVLSCLTSTSILANFPSISIQMRGKNFNKYNYLGIPEAIPAADPAAIRAILRSLLFSIISAHPIAQDLPISTLGPSGPSEHPVPKVIAAWMALIVGKIALMKSIPSR